MKTMTFNPNEFFDGKDLADFRELCKSSNWRGLANVALEWVTITLAIVLCQTYWNPLLYVATVIFLGSRQHALGILLHEAVHGQLCSRRKINEMVGNYLLAWPLFVTLKGYRENHLMHHKHTNSDKDPDLEIKKGEEWQFPRKKSHILMTFSKDILGLNTLSLLKILFRFDGKKTNRITSPKKVSFGCIARLTVYAGILISLYISGGLSALAMYWLVPFITWFRFSLRLRSIGEHFGVKRTTFLNQTRTTLANVFEKIFLAPHNINFHIEHHLVPYVPSYQLEKLHNLFEKNPVYQANAHVTKGYWGVIRECSL